MDITIREVIFSVFIIGILGAMGFYISSLIEKSVLDEQLAYRQAVQISSTNEFCHAMKTDVGMALVEGDFHALNPVTMDRCNGRWLKITADFQEYRMHTEHYTTKDKKGRVHHHTRVYWTWDSYDVKEKHAEKVNFCGITFKFEEFSYNHVSLSTETSENGYNKRIVFTCLPMSFHATIASKLYDNSIHDRPELLKGMDLAEAYEYLTSSYAVVIFWCFWSILIILACVFFYGFDNLWLED